MARSKLLVGGAGLVGLGLFVLGMGKKEGNAVMAEQHPATHTPLTQEEASGALANAFLELTGIEPTRGQHAMLMAHSALETGQWKKMYGYNWGFVTTPPGKRPWFEFSSSDPHKYRWFATAAEGAKDWLIAIRDKWPAAWALLDSGDTAAYVHALKHQGKIGEYFEAPEADYSAGVGKLYQQFYLPPLA